MNLTAAQNSQNALLRFLTAFFAMIGFHGGELGFLAHRDALFLNITLADKSKLAQLFSLRACGNAAAQLHRHVRRTTLKLLWLAQVRSGAPADNNPSTLPAMWPREACDYLTVQNVAGRVAALYRAWDNLEDQAGRLVRWINARDQELADDPPGGFATSHIEAL